MRIVDEIKLNFDDVMIVPKMSNLNSRSEVKLTRKFITLNSNIEINGFPIVASNLDVLGNLNVAKAMQKHSAFTALHKFHKPEDIIKQEMDGLSIFSNAFYTLGINDEDLNKFNLLKKHVNFPLVMIDTPNGYIKRFYDFVAKFREDNPGVALCVGNVTTPEAVVRLLLDCGADIIKTSIGTGGLCSTTETTGVGYPSLSATIECADAAHGIGGLIMADGGHRKTSDIAKSFCANADFVMLGSMLAGTDECEGEWGYTVPDYMKQTFDCLTSYPAQYKSADYSNHPNKIKLRLKAYGMSSREALDKYYNGGGTHRTSEGKVKYIDYKGTISGVMQHIEGALRSTGTYIGAAELKNFGKCSTFVKVR